MSVRIELRGNEKIGSALKRLKKACERAGVIRDVRRTEYYEKPSIKGRRKRERARMTAQKAAIERLEVRGIGEMPMENDRVAERREE